MFTNELGNVLKLKPVAPFKVCYNWRSFRSTRVGFEVPTIDLVLQNEEVYWRMFGPNSMVQVNDAVICLDLLMVV